MPGCCLIVALMLVGPRVVLAFAWLFSDWYSAFTSGWMALLGWLFLPWTSLAWIFTHFHNGGQLSGGYVILLGLGLLADVGLFGGGRAAHKRWQSDDRYLEWREKR